MPVACRVALLESLVEAACRVVKPRCRSAELVEYAKCGFQVVLVEELAAGEHVAFDRYKVDSLPLGVEALIRNTVRRMAAYRSEIAEPVYSLEVGDDVLAEVIPGADVSREVGGPERCCPAVVNKHRVWAY